MFSNPISFPRVNLLRWTNSGSKSKKKESLANVDHNLNISTKYKGEPMQISWNLCLIHIFMARKLWSQKLKYPQL
jgi:hypothetical protein